MGRIRLAAAAAIGDPVTVKALRERNQRPGERPLRSGPRARRGHQEARARGSCAAWSATTKACSDDGVMPALLGLVRQGDRRLALGYEINRPGPSLS